MADFCTLRLPEVLPVVPPLQADELLSSWIGRIEAYYDIAGRLGQHLGGDGNPCPGRHGAVFDVNPTPAMLERLARLTNHDVGMLARHTLAHDHPGWPMEWFADNHGPDPCVRAPPSGCAPNPAACPVCLAEMQRRPSGAYLRRDWSLTWSPLCRHHRLPLIDGCACGTGQPTFRWRPGGGCACVCPRCGGQNVANAPPMTVLGWSWLSDFEGALIAALDGEGLPTAWGGPAAPDALHTALSALVELWGRRADADSVLAWVVPSLFLPPERLSEAVTAATLGRHPAGTRRWFSAALAAVFLGNERWRCMDAAAQDVPVAWSPRPPGDRALAAGLGMEGERAFRAGLPRWPEAWARRASAALAWRAEAGRSAQDRRRRDRAGAGSLPSPHKVPGAAYDPSCSRASADPTLRLTPRSAHLQVARALLDSAAGRQALLLGGSARDRALALLVRKTLAARRT